MFYATINYGNDNWMHDTLYPFIDAHLAINTERADDLKLLEFRAFVTTDQLSGRTIRPSAFDQRMKRVELTQDLFGETTPLMGMTPDMAEQYELALKNMIAGKNVIAVVTPLTPKPPKRRQVMMNVSVHGTSAVKIDPSFQTAPDKIKEKQVEPEAPDTIRRLSWTRQNVLDDVRLTITNIMNTQGIDEKHYPVILSELTEKFSVDAKMHFSSRSVIQNMNVSKLKQFNKWLKDYTEPFNIELAFKKGRIEASEEYKAEHSRRAEHAKKTLGDGTKRRL